MPGQIDEALDILHATGPEFGGGLATGMIGRQSMNAPHQLRLSISFSDNSCNTGRRPPRFCPRNPTLEGS
jgi:hypothetical protein